MNKRLIKSLENIRKIKKLHFIKLIICVFGTLYNYSLKLPLETIFLPKKLYYYLIFLAYYI